MSEPTRPGEGGGPTDVGADETPAGAAGAPAPAPPPANSDGDGVAGDAPASESAAAFLGEPEVGDEPSPPPPPAATLEAADHELRAAVGVSPLPAPAPPRRDVTETDGPAPPPRPPRRRAATRDDDADERDDERDEDDASPKKRGKLVLLLAAVFVLGLGIAALVFLGQSNADRYFQRCHPDKITAERGRSFPPWGSERLGGPTWKPIAIPPGAECVSRETSSPAELAGWYLEALVEQAQAKLTAKEVTAVDQAQVELEQALLLARDPERRDQRKEIDRLLGDVEYWRGQARVRAAIDTLDEAARRYDAATEKRPRHASDAAAWAAHVRRLARDLAAGPGGVVAPLDAPAGEPPRADVPVGTALPVEEPAPAPPPDAGVAPIDAGLPQGGVLL